MRIPAEALLLYPTDNDRFSETRGTRPVTGSATLASDLPEGLPKPRQTPEAAPEYDRHATYRSRDGENDTPHAPPQERRHDDRRQKNIPTTLDTRLTRSRRRSAESAPINIEI